MQRGPGGLLLSGPRLSICGAEKQMRSRLTLTFDAILVICALVVTAATLYRVWPPAQLSDGAVAFEGWQDDLAFDRRIGPADARYRLVVWFDYQCPACRQFEEEIDIVRRDLGGEFAVVYRHFPLTALHPLAYQAAVAAECAKAQGYFPQMHHALFEAQLDGTSLPIALLVAQSGIPDARAFDACTTDPESPAVQAVEADLARVRTLNVNGTPAVQIGDRISTGGFSAADLLGRLRDSARN